MAQPRFRTTLVVSFAAAALLLAILGIYGVVSDGVGRRTRRRSASGWLSAPGAEKFWDWCSARRWAWRERAWPAASRELSLVTRSLSSLLFDVGRPDPPTYAGVALLLLAAAFLAAWIPARRHAGRSGGGPAAR